MRFSQQMFAWLFLLSKDGRGPGSKGRGWGCGDAYPLSFDLGLYMNTKALRSV